MGGGVGIDCNRNGWVDRFMHACHCIEGSIDGGMHAQIN